MEEALFGPASLPIEIPACQQGNPGRRTEGQGVHDEVVMTDEKRVYESGIYEQLGRIAANHSWLQFMLETVVWKMCDLDRDRGEALTGEMSFKTLVKTCCNLTDLMRSSDAFRTKFEKRLESLDQERNRVLHSQWDFPLPDDYEFASPMNHLLGFEAVKVFRRKYSRRRGRIVAEATAGRALEETVEALQQLAIEIGEWLLEGMDADEIRSQFWAGVLREMKQRSTTG